MRKKEQGFMLKIFLVFMLVSSTVMASMGGASAESRDWADVDWGTDIEASVDGDTLTLSGAGSMTDFNSTTNVQGLSEDGITTVVIGDGISSVGSSAFRNNSLSEVIIGNDVEIIGQDAFYGIELSEITFGNSVTTIGDRAFQNNDLTSITIPEDVTSIGVLAFLGNSLTSITIPNVTIIKDSAFAENSLTSITISETVTEIEYGAFSSNSLTSITIPSSVTSIGQYAFGENDITSITMLSDETEIDDWMLTWENDDNNFRNMFETEGAGKYLGTQNGTWTKISSNADLESLTISDGTFKNEFSASRTTYTVEEMNASELTITATPADANAAVTIDGTLTTSDTITLQDGENSIPVVVTAEDDEKTKTYTIQLIYDGTEDEPEPPNSNADLESLTISDGTFKNEFSASRTTYTVEEMNASKLTITAIPADANATVTIDGNTTTSDTITLQDGENSIPVVVTAEDGETTKTYTIQLIYDGTEDEQEPPSDDLISLSWSTEGTDKKEVETEPNKTESVTVNVGAGVGLTEGSQTVAVLFEIASIDVDKIDSVMLGDGEADSFTEGDNTYYVLQEKLSVDHDGDEQTVELDITFSSATETDINANIFAVVDEPDLSDDTSITFESTPFGFSLHPNGDITVHPGYAAAATVGDLDGALNTVDPNASYEIVNRDTNESANSSTKLYEGPGGSSIEVVVTAEDQTTKTYQLVELG